MAASPNPTDNNPAGQPTARRAEFDVGRPGRRGCIACGHQPEDGDILTAVLIELPRRDQSAGQFQRLDYCAACWPDAPWSKSEGLLDEGQFAHPADAYGAAPVAVWNARVSVRPKARRTFVDDTVLMNFFLRLADDADPERQRFRFVLMLILLRHRKLRHERTERGGEGGDAWRVRLMPAMAQATGTPPEQIHRVIDPRMDDSQIQQVAEQLSDILHEDLDTGDGG